MLERVLDIVNKWPQDIGDRWRQNLVKDVVSVVVTVVIVNTVKPLPLIYHKQSIYVLMDIPDAPCPTRNAPCIHFTLFALNVG